MRIERREFLAAAAAAPMLSLQGATGQLAPAALQPDAGELLHVGRTKDPVRIKVSPPRQGRFAMITQHMAPGSRIPVHLHEREDEIIFIHSGTGVATIGDSQSPVQAGSILYVPQGTWHGGENTGSSVMLWVAIYSPSGFEGYFREIAIQPDTGAPPQRTPEQWTELDRKYGIRYRR